MLKAPVHSADLLFEDADRSWGQPRETAHACAHETDPGRAGAGGQVHTRVVGLARGRHRKQSARTMNCRAISFSPSPQLRIFFFFFYKSRLPRGKVLSPQNSQGWAPPLLAESFHVPQSFLGAGRGAPGRGGRRGHCTINEGLK